MNEHDVAQQIATYPTPRTPRFVLVVALTFLVMSGAGVWLGYALTPPHDFPTEERLEIAAGTDLPTIATTLHREGYIRSPLAFQAVATLRGEAHTLKAGTYIFGESYSTPHLITRLAEGDFFNDLVRFTHVEGWRAAQLANAAEDALTDFDAAHFLTLAEPYEGQLYPDTYYIPAHFTEEELLELLLAHYRDTMDEYAAVINDHPLTEEEIIIMASILEREANTLESKRMVSGILQNRLAIDMPLQADAAIEYVLDKPLSELTPADLERDTPYNTYRYTGLPPTPIANPGRRAIEAVLDPMATEYFYYITGTDGQFYYAEDFDAHRENIDRYLRM